MKHVITLDPVKQVSKPKNEGEITQRIKDNSLQIEVTPKLLADFLTQPNGFTFCPAIFNKGYKDNNNFISSSLVVLDFDSKKIPTTPTDILRKFAYYDIKPNLWYTTFSDTNKLRKFRVILFLDTIITNVDEYTLILKSMLKMFPEADKACKNPSRMFYGGISAGSNINPDNISYTYLMDILKTVTISKDFNKTRNLKEFENVKPSLSGDNIKLSQEGTCINIYNTDTIIRQKWETKEFDFNKAVETVLILKDFYDLKWLHYPELFGIATNLQYINGGLKWFKDILIKFNEINKDKRNEHGELIQYNDNIFAIPVLLQSKNYNYLPQNLENFSPYPDDHVFINIITAIKVKKNYIEQIQPINKMSLEIAEAKLQSEFKRVLKVKDNKIYLFKVATALGKTELLTNVNDNILIAAPTNELKQEIANRYKYSCTITPELKLSDLELQTKINHLYNSGAGEEVYKLLLNIIKYKTYHTDYETIKKYIKDTDNCYRSLSTVITTHSRYLLNTNKFNQDTIIFDEDPLNYLISLDNFDNKDLLKCYGYSTELDNDFITVQNDIKKARIYNYVQTPSFKINATKLLDCVVDNSLDTNIINFFSSKFFNVNNDVVTYVNTKPLLENKKYIILSATASETVYKRLYGDRLEVINISDITNKGKVTQYTKNSYSRASFSGNNGQKVLDKIVERVQDLAVITHSNYKHHFKNPVKNMHYGNCSGYDNLKGTDIAVVGTPHLPQEKYALFGCVLGLDLRAMDLTLTYQIVEYNGFKFYFNTFMNKDLQDIQLSLIESELIQAAGRNRVLREDCITEIYSNLPLRISDEYITA